MSVIQVIGVFLICACCAILVYDVVTNVKAIRLKKRLKGGNSK